MSEGVSLPTVPRFSDYETKPSPNNGLEIKAGKANSDEITVWGNQKQDIEGNGY